MKCLPKRFVKHEHLLIVCVAVYILFFFLLAILRYKSFFSYEWEDVVEVNNFYWNVSHGNIIEYLSGWLGQEKYYLVHIAPMFFLISWVYFFVPHIYTVFFITAFFLGISAVPIYQIGLKVLKQKNIALILAISYLLYAPKNSLNFLDGDTSIYTIVLLLYAFYTALSGKKKRFIVFGILIVLCRTETPLYLAVLSFYFFLRRKLDNRISRKFFLLVSGLSLCIFIFNFFLLNYLSQDSLCYSCRESNIFETLIFLFKHPTLSFLSDIQKQSFVKLLFPVFFVPIFTFEFLLGAPAVFFLIIVDEFVFQRAHYISSMIPSVFIGMIFFIKNMKKSGLSLGVLVFLIFLGCLISNFTPNIIGGTYSQAEGVIKDQRFLGVTNIYDKKFYTMDEDDKIAWRMINLIPKDGNVAVAASGDVMVPLSSRKKIVEFLDDTKDYYDVDYILIHNKHMYMGAGHYFWDDQQMSRELDNLLKSDLWKLLDQENEFYLFKRKIAR